MGVFRLRCGPRQGDGGIQLVAGVGQVSAQIEGQRKQIVGLWYIGVSIDKVRSIDPRRGVVVAATQQVVHGVEIGLRTGKTEQGGKQAHSQGTRHPPMVPRTDEGCVIL